MPIDPQVFLARRYNQLLRYQPYDKQKAFHEAGNSFRERLLCAGNRDGKSYCASREVAIHATGLYPDWWKGRRFTKPVLIWTGSETNETSKEITQTMLLGTSNPSLKSQDMGTGAIPRHLIVDVKTRQAGVKGVVNEIYVRHTSGGISRVALKTYEMERTAWQGVPVDIVWNDEEAPADVYSEGLTRTIDTDGLVMTTFTPLKGWTAVVTSFFRPEEGSTPKHVTNMTIYDAKHFDGKDRAAIIASWPEHERETRAMGVPMAGEGKVFPVAEDTIKVDPFEIPRHFARIAGVDFGIDHPASAVWLAWDRDTDIVYLYDCYKKKGETSVYHAAAINGRDPQGYIPVAWPHDGLNRDKGGGRPLWKMYRDHPNNVRMMKMSARYEDDIGGAQGVEPIVIEMLERMKTGRFKVFSHLTGFFDEFRMYHRKDGKIVPMNDDIISGARMAMIMLRKARVYMPVSNHQPKYTRPIVGARI